MELACTNSCTVSDDTWITVAAAWTALAAASTSAEDTCKIAINAWKVWAYALKASKDKRNITLDACNALKIEPSSWLVDAKLLEADVESSNVAVKASALAVKAVYESMAHHSFGAHGTHA
jgi:hypothetical protein